MSHALQPLLRYTRGTLFAALLALAAGPVGAQADEPFTLNLQQAELRSLIDTVSRRTGRNFVVDPRVDARVTVISSQPVGDDELYEVFQTVLSVHGYATVDAGDVTKIVPAATAKQGAVPMGEAGDPRPDIVTRVIAVDNVQASQLVPILRPLLPQEAHLAAYQPTNRLLVTDTAANIERISAIIERVDRPLARETEVVRLEHARADAVVRIVNSLQDGEGAERSRVAADTRTNSVIIRGEEADRLQLRTLIANLDSPVESDGNTRVIYMKHADAEDLVSILEGVSQGRGQGRGENGEAEADTIIQADANTNALILTGSPGELDGLESIVRQLDIRRAQVLVEAIIAELSTDRARELGVQFAARSGDDGAAAATSFGSGGSNIVNLINNPASIASGLTVGAVDQTSDGDDFAVLLRALASDSDNNILSTPSLVTLDNQEAEIVVGQNVPFITGSFSSDETGGGANNPFQTIERRDVGITLKVKPQINDGDTVKMDIEQEVSNLTETALAASDLVTNTRSLTTTVLVEDAQTLVLGGLMDDTVRTRTEKVPLLGDIPVLGRLFSFESTSTEKQNLMVFIQPRILRDVVTADAETEERYDMMRQGQLERAERAPGFGGGNMPLLPELELHYGDPDDGS